MQKNTFTTSDGVGGGYIVEITVYSIGFSNTIELSPKEIYNEYGSFMFLAYVDL